MINRNGVHTDETRSIIKKKNQKSTVSKVECECVRANALLFHCNYRLITWIYCVFDSRSAYVKPIFQSTLSHSKCVFFLVLFDSTNRKLKCNIQCSCMSFTPISLFWHAYTITNIHMYTHTQKQTKRTQRVPRHTHPCWAYCKHVFVMPVRIGMMMMMGKFFFYSFVSLPPFCPCVGESHIVVYIYVHHFLFVVHSYPCADWNSFRQKCVVVAFFSV